MLCDAHKGKNDIYIIVKQKGVDLGARELKTPNGT